MQNLHEVLDPFQPEDLSIEQKQERAGAISNLAVKLNKALFEEVFPALGSTHDSHHAGVDADVDLRARSAAPDLRQQYVAALPPDFASILALSVRLHDNQLRS